MPNSNLILSNGVIWTASEWERQQELSAPYRNPVRKAHAENERTR